MPVGSRLVGTPRFGIGTSEHGRDYRLGYGVTVAQGGAMNFDLGVYANRRVSPAQVGAGRQKREFRLDAKINALESRVNTQIGEPRERMAHLVGLLEALRETITGLVAS